MLFPKIADYLSALPTDIPTDRRALLDPLAEYISRKRAAGEVVRLIFICTHNSRRSHFGQVWAQVAALYFGIGPVECYSGGMETTACNPRTVAALERAGIRVKQITTGENPVLLLQYADGVNPLAAFSKVYNQAPNPTQGFAAVMTCSQAEENCPYVAGAEKRFSITYDDPKIADGTPEEEAVYDARCRQVAAEMAYVFGKCV
ncbi:MAG: protein-tyrosine-phosphatase [Saprospiraceae bacterium]|jgi:arsenate reductase|nr:protein-tyrosine-phosphatase [Saprospiraceae bacterium]